jgi:hypothetical protein
VEKSGLLRGAGDGLAALVLLEDLHGMIETRHCDDLGECLRLFEQVGEGPFTFCVVSRLPSYHGCLSSHSFPSPSCVIVVRGGLQRMRNLLNCP